MSQPGWRGFSIMKILVISDTHGDTRKAEEAIRKNREADLVIHLGDYIRDVKAVRYVSGYPFRIYLRQQ